MSQPAAAVVTHVLAGAAAPYGPGGEPSAIDKRPIAGCVHVGALGVAGDEQADTRHHGGVDKALHHYPAEHYANWRDDLPQVPPDRWRPGGFGENLSTNGLTEAAVCVGDVFRLGEALLQVSQARQPCWKLNLRFGLEDMARRVQASGRTGWYYRVLEPGDIAAGAVLKLIDRPHPQWPLKRLLHQLYADPMNRAALDAMSALEVLASSWRKLATERLAAGRVEDWSRRLDTPAAGTGGRTAWPQR